jgi:ribosomal protein S18 acetylase RimI-like enzyme
LASIIRKIIKDEYAIVVPMFDKYRVFYNQDSNLELALDYLKKRLINNEAHIFLASNAQTQEPLGFTLLYARFSSVSAQVNWHIGDLYVEPAHRERGIGKKLMEAAIAFAHEENAQFVSLNTARDNYGAQRVYEKFGFELRDYLPQYLYYQFDL